MLSQTEQFHPQAPPILTSAACSVCSNERLGDTLGRSCGSSSCRPTLLQHTSTQGIRLQKGQNWDCHFAKSLGRHAEDFIQTTKFQLQAINQSPKRLMHTRCGSPGLGGSLESEHTEWSARGYVKAPVLSWRQAATSPAGLRALRIAHAKSSRLHTAEHRAPRAFRAQPQGHSSLALREVMREGVAEQASGLPHAIT